MKSAKQVIVMRKDLNMRKGKMVAQGSHASLGAILKQMSENGKEERILSLREGSALKEWIEGKFTKICVSVDSEEELVKIHRQALAAGLISCLITDSGMTEFAGNPTITCCAIGPEWSEEIDSITSHLKLL